MSSSFDLASADCELDQRTIRLVRNSIDLPATRSSTSTWAYDDDDDETNAAILLHHEMVAYVSASAKELFDRGLPYRVFHGSTNTTRPRDATQGPPLAVLNISGLDRILRIDTTRRCALVEPNVPMDRLVAAIQRASGGTLVPPVVMEFPGITAGGGFAGTGGESSSFRHGFFDETVSRVEMVLADGAVVVAADGGDAVDGTSPSTMHHDLFHAAAGAVGSLGTVTLLEIRLVQARKWVRTTYIRTSSVAEAVATVRKAVQRGLSADDSDPPDFVDGILYSPTHGAIMRGVLTDDKPANVQPQTFSDPWDPWFYLHAYKKTASRGTDQAQNTATAVDYIPLAEYLFRYDRGGFWVGRMSFLYFFMVPFNRLTRWLFDDILHTRMMYRAMHAGSGAHAFVLQDMAVPFDRAADLVGFTAATFGIWPLWLCPLRRRPGPTFHPAMMVSSADEREAEYGAGTHANLPKSTDIADTHMLNIGLWGPGPLARSLFRARNRALEDKLTALGGRKWLYASTYFAEDDFWNLYGGRAWYDVLRTRYRAAEALPSVFDKVRAKDDDGCDFSSIPWREKLKFIWPLGGILGIWHSLRTKDYLLHRYAEWRYKAGDGE
ncbi:FAD-binding domain containing protein [Grosmannia clavigera kw1407]|uniref:Delta(24)-sterol reductase n=1 Tax=Grosmannia clavigera (strain kw1407 / UAMH 11150) TaxID=655863 RepID=F0XLC7_GROCL|nr:FAD-binding domain containing protein [Grosmannia clavigera kw1407]EFX01057.1 FAD-binding domain containing protein [Grosmannia clavigera kw1407]